MKLNPVIKGWSEYHKHIVSSEAFNWTDHEIFNSLRSWALYRHPMKTKGWISRKYYHTINNRKWTFATPSKNPAHKTKTGYLSLNCAVDTPIYRFTKVKSMANPFDKDWQQYFEEREGEKMICGSKGRHTLVKLWKSQNKLCPACGEENRKILINCLERAGFINYPTEWWHWSYGDCYWAFMNNCDALYSVTDENEII